MNKRLLATLLVMNVALLTALALIGSPPEARAQLGSKGEYVMIAGEVLGKSDQSAVYIIDVRNQRMTAVTFDSRNKKLDRIASRQLP